VRVSIRFHYNPISQRTGDHGITLSHPGVSAYPREVTRPIFQDIASGTGASAILSRSNGCELNIVDVGIDTCKDERYPYENGGASFTIAGGAHHITVTQAKVSRGSRDMTQGPALTPEERAAAQNVGAEAVRRYLAEHAKAHPAPGAISCNEDTTGGASSHSRLALCIGELGIGNTTAAAALVAALTGSPAALVTGKGTGLDPDGVNLKAQAIEKALAANSELVRERDPAHVLEAVGGLELAAMVGAYLEAGRWRMPILVDGFVSGAAALVALHFHPPLAAFLFWSHQSDEKGASVLLQAVATKAQEIDVPYFPPPLMMSLRLGEGTGALLALPLLRSACAIMREMVTMDSMVEGKKECRGIDSETGSNQDKKELGPK